MTENKRSALVSGTAWAFILLGGYHAARAAYDNFTLAELFSSPGFMLGLAGSTLPVQLPPLARLVVEHIQVFFVLYFLVSLTVCVAGTGLLARKPWARTAAVWLFYLSAAAACALFLFPELLVPKPYLFEGRALTPGFNEVMGRLRFQTRLLAAALCACAVWLARRLERPEVRQEFGTKIS
jgi:hypothetical protein